MNVAITIPAYNEKDNVVKLAIELSQILNNAQIVIVDDSMEDSISSKINNIPNVKHIFRGKKLGRGSAVLEGFTSLIKNSKADVFVEMDADYSHNPNELKENLILFNEKNWIY